MENIDNTIDVELQVAQEALRKAQQRKADAGEAARIAAQAALAKNLADEQERLICAQEENKHIQEKWAKKRAAEEAERHKAEVAKLAVTRRLEQEVEIRAQAQREEAARLERIRKVTEAAHQAELEAQQIENDLQRTKVIPEESKPASLGDLPSALSNIFGVKSTETSEFITAISSEEQAKLQTDKDRATILAEVVRKPKPVADSYTSGCLEQLLIRELKIQINSARCDEIASRFNCEAVVGAAKQVVEAYKQRAMGHDSIFFMLDSILEGMAVTQEASNAKEQVA